MLALMAHTMTCPECGVVGGLRLEWKPDHGEFNCNSCGPLSSADPMLQG